jgi:hypothetical protein
MIDDKTLFVHLLVISIFVQYSARTWNTLNQFTVYGFETKHVCGCSASYRPYTPCLSE